MFVNFFKEQTLIIHSQMFGNEWKIVYVAFEMYNTELDVMYTH